MMRKVVRAEFDIHADELSTAGIVETCLEWFDGKRFRTMHDIAFRSDQPEGAKFDLRKLYRELSTCLDECNMDKERPRLEAAIAWTKSKIDRIEFEGDMRWMCERAVALGVRQSEVIRMVETHWENLTRGH